MKKKENLSIKYPKIKGENQLKVLIVYGGVFGMLLLLVIFAMIKKK